MKRLITAVKKRKEKIMKSRLLSLAVQAALTAGLAVSPSYAQSETQIVRGVNEVLKMLVLIMGPTVLGYGLLRGFIAHGAGDEDGLQSARNAIIGGLGILFTFTLVNLIVRASGVSI